MNACTKQYYTIEVRGWWEPLYFVCYSPKERDAKLSELYKMWDSDDRWRVSNPRIIVSVCRYSASDVRRGRY